MLRDRLQAIYKRLPTDEIERWAQRLETQIRSHAESLPPPQIRSWDQQDVVLITYGDQVSSDDNSGDADPLTTLNQFLLDNRWQEAISTVHLLPFCPYSSDDGFSVIDYRAVDPAIGSWESVALLGRNFRLMFDLVLNHCSAESPWFARYLRGEEPYSRFFIEVEADADLSAVVRPRSLPLLTEVQTAAGPRRVWTTFSADQVDLNYAEPEVLLAMIDILLEYVARGAQIVRLDAVAFLWKELGTRCIHLAETHEVVKLLREVLQTAAPHVWVITETNVPHAENISYFGQGDEAHLVYQFALPPLLLDALMHGDATYFSQWLSQLDPPARGATFFNFTASHDGVGVRPLEGLVPPERVASLVEGVQRRGGLISTRRQGAADVPYELNISYVDACAAGPNELAEAESTALHARRFLATQAVMLGLQGVPAPYFHSLVGSRNNIDGVESSGQPRRINRRKFSQSELLSQLEDPASLSSLIYAGYRRLLQVRRRQAAFHPDGRQRAVDVGRSDLICFSRQSPDGRQTILVAANVSAHDVELDAAATAGMDVEVDLISGERVGPGNLCQLAAGQAVWLQASGAD